MRHVRLPMNVFINVRPFGEVWSWEINNQGAQLLAGTASTEMKAKKEAWKRLGEALQKPAETKQKRAELRSKLKYWARRRPYMVAHVLYSLAENGTRKNTIENAPAEEKRLWKREQGAPGQVKFPSHPLAKPPGELAGVLFDICKTLGYVDRRAFSVGTRLLGMGFSHGDHDSHYDVMISDTDVEETDDPEEETEE